MVCLRKHYESKRRGILGNQMTACTRATLESAFDLLLLSSYFCPIINSGECAYTGFEQPMVATVPIILSKQFGN
jgi:hypothetical protein